MRSPFAEARSFFVYLSVGTEVDTRALAAALLKAKKTVCVPRVLGNENMIAVPWSDDRERNTFGIDQPKTGEDTFCEIALTPLLAADGLGNRLGYGGGYYDRYFLAHPETVRIGLMYEGQTLAVPAEETDVPLDCAVTERSVKIFSHRRIAGFPLDTITQTEYNK